MRNQIIAIIVVFLFIGITASSSIQYHVVKAAQENDFIEVTTEACGITGFGNTTVKLTKQQYSDLEQYLIEFREDLNQTTTREEAVPIFKEAVVELDKYGLLPRGMSVQQAEKLVTGEYLNSKILKFAEKIIRKISDPIYVNYLCLTMGVIQEPLLITPIAVLVAPIFYLALPYCLMRAFFGFGLGPLIDAFFFFLLFGSAYIAQLSALNPFSLVLAGEYNDCHLLLLGLLGPQLFMGNVDGTLYGYMGLSLMVQDMHYCILLGFSLACFNEVNS